jgi:hypothetical protein
LSGRVVDARETVARIEVAEGVVAECRLKPADEPAAEKKERSSAPVDIGSLTAMLNAKWKEGKGGEAGPKRDVLKTGQIRSVKIVALDPAKKKIEVELLG